MKVYRFVIAIVLFLSAYGVLSAQLNNYDIETKLLAEDGTGGDNFGFSISIDNNFAIIGAPYEDDDGTNTGSAYIFHYDGSSWNQHSKLVASDRDSADYFGWSVAIDGNIAVVGAPNKGWNNQNSGAVYVFYFDGNVWTQMQKLEPGSLVQWDPINFGQAVDIDNDIIIIGADAFEGVGSVYVFRNENGVWIEELKVAPDNNWAFGKSLSISGNVFVSGAYHVDPGGIVYVYTYTGSEWEEEIIFASDREINDEFGYSVSIDGQYIIVGAPSEREQSTSYGAAYIFEFDGNNWIEHAKLTANDRSAYDDFGNSVNIDGNIAIIGAHHDDHAGTEEGSVYLYAYDGINWNQATKIVPDDVLTGGLFGSVVCINNKRCLVSMPEDDDNGGSAGASYTYDLIIPPIQAIVSNGLNTNARISWTPQSTSAENHKIFRDGQEIGSVPNNINFFTDYDGIPGKIHRYGVAAHSEYYGKSEECINYGWAYSDGRVDGRVYTPMYAGVPDVRISAEPKNDYFRSLQFDGNDDLVMIDPISNFPDTALTASFWLKADAGFQGGGLISFANTSYDNSFLINNYDNIEVWVGATGSNINTGVQSNDGNWHHFAITWRSSDGQLIVYRDGNLSYSGNLSQGVSILPEGVLVFGQDQDEVGGGFDPAQAFEGFLDEVRLWNYARSQEEIQADMYHILSGKEVGLVACWPFDHNTDADIAGDMVVNGGHHGTIWEAVMRNDDIPAVKNSAMTDANGDYSIKSIYYGEGIDFNIIPEKEEHGFDPASRSRSLDVFTPYLDGVNFTDTTSYTASGMIRFAGSNCPVEGVEILLNGMYMGVNTDVSGMYAIAINEPGLYTIKPRYQDHHFMPAETTLIIEDDIGDLNFRNIEEHTLRVRLAGGTCAYPLGGATFQISTMGAQASCFDSTIISPSGSFAVSLPAQPYAVSLTAVASGDPLILDYFTTAKTADLTSADDTLLFIYHKIPDLEVEGFNDFTCSDPVIPVLKQGTDYSLLLKASENFSGEVCPLDSGFIYVYDNVSSDATMRDTLEIIAGQASFALTAGKPNIAEPYTKQITFIVESRGFSFGTTLSVIVAGNRPRSQTFATVSPQIPFMILRDPPGDASYSYLSAGVSTSRSFRFYALIDAALKTWAQFRAGAKFEVGWGFITEVDVWGKIRGELEIGGWLRGQTEWEVTMKALNTIATSGNPNISGERGDVFMGAALNLVYALTDVISYDQENCRVEKSTAVIMGIDGFATTFMYTEDHIRNTLIPQLTQLRDAYMEAAQTMPVKADTARTYEHQISVWQQVLANNQKQKNVAKFIENRSFSAGVQFEASNELNVRHSRSLEFGMWINQSIATEAGLEIAGNGVSAGVEISTHFEMGVALGQTVNYSCETGYVLNDDDIGDFFSVDIKYDETYAVPVFDLVSGRSSCPHEAGTLPRDGVQLAIDPPIRYDIPPEEPASYTLSLRNLSESDESREYHLRVIQASNLDGAIIKVSGTPMAGPLSYFIPPGEQITATLTVDRGPIAYDYDNLQVMLCPPCEYENWQTGRPLTIADTVTFSTHFISPCSGVTLYRPFDDWLINQSSSDSLQIILRDYNPDNINLKDIRLEYRKKGEGWNPIVIFMKSDLPRDYINYYWNISNLSNGEYQIRAAANCGLTGLNYSRPVSGVVDRNRLFVYGTPTPADNILNIGEDISIAFTGELDCDHLAESGLVTLMRLQDSLMIDITAQCNNNRIIISPVQSLANYEGQVLRATVANIADVSGNLLSRPVSWDFVVNRNPVYWHFANVDKTVYQSSDEQFSAEILNAGGSTESFTLEGFQNWLSPDATTEQLPAGGHLIINFDISSQLNPGTYRDTLYAVTDRGNEPLYVKLLVLTQPPSWQFNPNAYQYSMSMIAEVALNDSICRDEYDIIAAIVNNEIRGKTNIQYVPEINGYLAFLTMHSNLQSGEEIELRFWDASSNTEYGSVEESFTFEDNIVLGSLFDPVTLHPSGVAQTIDLNQGWSWFSLNVEEADMSLGSVFGNITERDGDLIKTQDAFSQYSDNTGWAGTLEAIEPGRSYMLRLSQSGNVWFTGAPVDALATPITLNSGWNWIGYLPDTILPVDSALTFFDPSPGDIIKSQTAFAEFDQSSDSWLGSLEFLEPGSGYLLNSALDKTVVYPASQKRDVKNSRGEIASVKRSDFPECEVNMNAYEYTMNIIGVLKMNGGESRDSLDVVGAFVDDTCRGLAQPVLLEALNRHEVFLMVYGNKRSGETVNFLIYDHDKDQVSIVDADLPFVNNRLTGDIDAPHEFKVLDVTAPELNAFFLFTTEKSLSRYVRLFIAANEPLAAPPTVKVINTSSQQTFSGKLFSEKEYIYVLDYYVEQFGQSDYIISAGDYSGNTTADSLSLSVFMLKARDRGEYEVDDRLHIISDSKTVEKDGYLYVQKIKAGNLLLPAGDLKSMSPVFDLSSSRKLKGSISLRYDVRATAMTEEEMRKIRLYTYDENDARWVPQKSRLDDACITAQLSRLDTVAFYYDEAYIPIPDEFALHQNYPNPFNPETTIRFDLPEPQMVTLSIYNILGQEVKTLISEKRDAGYHKITWDGRNNYNNRVATGLYIYRIRAGTYCDTKKMILLK